MDTGRQNSGPDHGWAQISSGIVEISSSGEDCGKVFLTPGEGVLLWINGQRVYKSTGASPGDQIKVEGKLEQREAQVKVNIAADQMSAEAIYLPPVTINHLIQDQPPAAELIITAVQEKITSGPDLSPKEIMDALKSCQVVHGINESVLPKLVEHAGTWNVVATGTQPVQGKHGYVEFLFKEGLQQVSYDQDQARVDYKRRFEIPQVDKGQVIAIIRPPSPGQPGMTVKGKEILPAPVKEAEVLCESGTILDKEHNQVIATMKGVPAYRQGRKVLLRVDGIYHHQGDIDIKAGHTNFAGHLKITGGIAEGMRVKAEGDIEIAGHTSGAEIVAGGSIVIKRNCLKCLVQAGWFAFQMKKVSRFYEDLTSDVDSLTEMCRELINALQERGTYKELQINFLLRSLVQKKFPDLPGLCTQTLELIRELYREMPGTLAEGIVEAMEKCNQHFQGSGVLLTWESLQGIHQELVKHQGLMKFSDPEAAGITAYYVQNSRLTCSGDILVSGPGAYNSVFECGGQARITRIFRGGSIKAGSDIHIGEAGIPRLAEIQGTIETSSRGQVYVEKIYENTRIKIGKPEIKLDKSLNRVRFYLDEYGEINIGNM